MSGNKKSILKYEKNLTIYQGSLESIKGIGEDSYIFIENYPQLLYTF